MDCDRFGRGPDLAVNNLCQLFSNHAGRRKSFTCTEEMIRFSQLHGGCRLSILHRPLINPAKVICLYSSIQPFCGSGYLPHRRQRIGVYNEVEFTGSLSSVWERKIGRKVNKICRSAAKYVLQIVTWSPLVNASAIVFSLKWADSYTTFLLTVWGLFISGNFHTFVDETASVPFLEKLLLHAY